MIRIDRPAETQKIRNALNKPLGATAERPKETELERARAYYNADPPPTTAFKFKRYKELAVCEALDDMCHEKCAYCESSYRAVSSGDVEHYRPKGKVKEAADGHPGYWWLAAEWSNLLPSCQLCNQLRRQVPFKPGMSLAEFEEKRRKRSRETSGKGNSFPVRGNNWITREDQSTDEEDPLLINPCERDPGDHLDWDIRWDRNLRLWDAQAIVPAIVPKNDNGQDDPYAEKSIAIYGLNRAGLFRGRMALLQFMRKSCRSVVDTLEDLSEEGVEPARRQRLLDRLRRNRKDLYGFATAEQPYAAMASAFIALFAQELQALRGS